MHHFKKPDLTAPRFRRKVHNVLNIALYKEFKKKYPKYQHIDYKTFRSIIKRCNDVFKEKVIEYREGVELPQSLGFIFIGTCDPGKGKKLNVDYAKSIQYNTLITHKNWETDGKLGKIFYTNYSVKYKVIDRQLWKFTPCRNFSRTVKAEYPKDWTKYIKVDSQTKISRLYNNQFEKHKKQVNHTLLLDNYNEFEF